MHPGLFLAAHHTATHHEPPHPRVRRRRSAVLGLR
jgi:hypothetical protein